MTRYGPHRPEDAPTTVVIGYGSNERQVPMPAALLVQREAINRLAHGEVVHPTKAEALDRVNAKLSAADKARIDAAILEVARRGSVFSANEVRPLLPESLTEGGVMGGRFGALSKAGDIVHVGYVPSSKSNTHGHDIKTWRLAEALAGAA